jgi:hypothetical protein
MSESNRDNPANHASSRTRVDVVMDALRERIASRSLMPGARVPSIRVMTETLGVSNAAGAGRSGPASGPSGRSAVAYAAVARSRAEGAEARLRLVAGVMVAGRRRAPCAARGGA